MLTRQTLIGFLGNDAEIRQVGDHTVMNFSIACSRGKDRDPLWVQVALWNPPAGLEKYLQKGKLVAVEGVPTEPNKYFRRAAIERLLQPFSSMEEFTNFLDENTVAQNRFTAFRVITESKSFVADEKPATVATQQATGGVSVNIGGSQPAASTTTAKPQENFVQDIAQKILEALGGQQGQDSSEVTEVTGEIPF